MKQATIILGLLCVLALWPQVSVSAASKKCTVVRRIHGCDYFVVETADDYAVLEWMGGYDPDKDDRLVGNLSTFGFQKFVDETVGDSVQIYVEDYALTRTNALDKLSEKCSA